MKTEMNKLEDYLKEHSYMYGRTEIWDGEQIIVYGESINDIKWDALCCSISYGGKEGLLEIMGEIVPEGNDVLGYLKAEDIIKILEGRK